MIDVVEPPISPNTRRRKSREFGRAVRSETVYETPQPQRHQQHLEGFVDQDQPRQHWGGFVDQDQPLQRGRSLTSSAGQTSLSPPPP